MNSRLQKASLLMANGDYVGAEKICRSALKIGKDVIVSRQILAQSLYNQSVMLLRHPDLLAEAERLLREAECYSPANFDIQNNLGALLLLAKRYEEAVVHLSKAVTARPEVISARMNLAIAQEEAGRHAEASDSLHVLADLDPQNNAAYLLRDALLLSAIVPDQAAIDHSRMRTEEKLKGLFARNDLQLSNPLHFPSTYFRFAYHGPSNKEINSLMAAVYAKSCPVLSWQAPNVAEWTGPGPRIRIGLLSAFFRNHSVGSVSRGFFECLDRQRFEVVALRVGVSAPDETASVIDGHADRVVHLDNQSLDAARAAINDLKLDVLFYQDIGMDPFSYFLAFSRLAPLQLTWFGHPDTTGIPAMDAYLSASLYETEASQTTYSERLVIMLAARNISYYRRPKLPISLEKREDFGLSDAEHLYCCPQQLFKLHPAMDSIFSDICEQDPLARIVLFESGEKQWRKALEQRMAAHSADLAARVVFLPSLSYERYLYCLKLSDVVLDTLAFNGYNTTLEALSVGTPVVTMPGSLQRQRFGSAIYEAMGFTTLVACSTNDYVAKALRLASEPEFRADCCRQIEMRVPTLFEEETVIRDFETVITALVNERCSQISTGSGATG